MDKSLFLPQKWTLHVVPPEYPKHLLISAAKFAHHSPLIVLDCGRQFDASIVARAAGGHKEITDRIFIQQAFICSEVTQLIQETPEGKTPILILDLLSTFYDENVKMHRRKFLLVNVLFHLRRLSRGAGLAVSVREVPATHESFRLFQFLRTFAPRVLNYEIPPAKDYTRQLSFF
jgi:hypothetical protein